MKVTKQHFSVDGVTLPKGTPAHEATDAEVALFLLTDAPNDDRRALSAGARLMRLGSVVCVCHPDNLEDS